LSAEPEPTFVLVGHCWPDRRALKSAVTRAVPGARVVNAGDMAALGAPVDGKTVLLVNRVLEGRFAIHDGVELIRRLYEGDDPPTTILVSDYPEAQADAVAAGARPGFGKSQLRDEQTARRLREAAQN
jgi:hypothetical protein